MKNYDQSKKAKKEFKSIVFDYMIQEPRVYTKEELAAHFDFDTRTIRCCLARISNYYPVIATSNKKGYKIATWTDQMSSSELEDVKEEILHEIAELNSRIKNLKARLKPLIANKVVLDRKITDLKLLEEADEQLQILESMYEE